MYTIKLNARDNKMTLKRFNNTFELSLVGRRGLPGADGQQGEPGLVQSIVAGTNVTVDSTDPANPIVSSSGGGGGGAVDSVNGQTGVVVLDATDVGADPSGSATTALESANDYTDSAIASINYPVDSVNGQTNTVVLDTDDIQDTATNRYTNDTDIARLASTSGTNTGDQDLSPYALQTTVDLKQDLSEKGEVNGYAELDSNGLVPSSQLPSYVDDVLVYANLAAFPATGVDGKIYIASDTNLTYRWSGSAYVEISASLALGETSSTAYRGDRGKIAYDHSQDVTTNPHNVTKSQVGLGNADNTADPAKNVLSATKLTTARTIDGQSFDGSASITVVAPATHAATSKTTPVDADEIPLVDSAASNVLKRLTWANLKATLKTYFDSLTTTLTNKRITARVFSTASSATPTFSTDDYDAVHITALAANINTMSTNITGTPNNFDKLIFRIKDDGTARTIVWGTLFESKGVTLPSTTVVNKVMTVGFIYSTVTSKWGCVALAQEA